MIGIPVQFVAIIALVASMLSFGAAWKVQGWRSDAADKERIEAAAETLKLQRKTAGVASASHESDKIKLKTEFLVITSEVEHVIEKPGYDADCFDADGMRVLARAIRLTGDASQPEHPLPAAPAPEGR